MVFHLFAVWVAQGSTPAQRVLLTLTHALMLSWAAFLALTSGWFLLWLLSGGALSFPWPWLVTAAIISGVVLARELSRVRRKQLMVARNPDGARQVVAEVGRFIASRAEPFGRQCDLPYPRAVIELAFSKAVRDWPDDETRNAVEGLYVTLDRFMLSDEDYELLAYHHRLITRGAEAARPGEPPDSETIRRLAEEWVDVDIDRGREVLGRLSDLARHRLQKYREMRQLPPE